VTGLERLRYWQGQLLRSTDFRDQLRHEEYLRSRHNTALHKAFGIVSGLQIKDGKVTCGFGYDCFGRELIVPGDLPLPARISDQAQLLVLLAAKPGQCSALAWIDELDWNGNQGLPLARVSASGTDFDPEYGAAPYVRAMARPHLASGETVRGNTPWELWKEGAVEVGVQTRVDTSGAGFTEMPHYFATLKAKQWPLASTAAGPAAEFAPAYFAHVAQATSAGFTFRLLLQDVALRRYEPRDALTRIKALNRDGSFLSATLEAGTPFEKGDAVVQVRPRAEAAALIQKVEGPTLTLASDLELKGDDRLVLGNLPRTATVKEVTQETDTFVTLSALDGAIAGSILGRFDADNAKARASRIARVKDGKVLLRDPWPGLAANARVHLFHRKEAVKLTDAKTEGGVTTITVPADANLQTGDAVIHLSGRQPAPPAMVTAVEVIGDAAKVTIKPAFVELKDGASVVASRLEVTVAAVDTPTGSLEIVLADDSPFEEHDYLKPLGRAGAPAIVEFSDGPVVRLRAPASWTAAGDVLVAGNFTGALTVEGTRVEGGSTIIDVARPAALRTGYAVVRLDSETTVSAPSLVNRMPGSELSLEPAIPGLQRFQTLIAIQFPAVVRIASVAENGRIRIDPAGACAAGDWLAAMNPAGTFPIAQVTSVNGDGSLSLSRNLDLAVDTRLGQVHFRDTTLITSVDALNKTVEMKESLDVHTPADFAGPWIYYEDNASAATVDNVSGAVITLRPLTPDGITGEGMIASGAFDAGLLAYASISPQQGRIVLDEPPGLEVGDPVTLSGSSSLGTSITVPMKVSAADQAGLTLEPTLGVPYLLRPERSSLASKFNENFPTSFAIFAQRLGLYVAWLGCQDEHRSLPMCGETKEDPCR
jgi:hypothetical protein